MKWSVAVIFLDRSNSVGEPLVGPPTELSSGSMRKPLVDVLLTEDFLDFDGTVHDAKVDAADKASK